MVAQESWWPPSLFVGRSVSKCQFAGNCGGTVVDHNGRLNLMYFLAALYILMFFLYSMIHQILSVRKRRSPMELQWLHSCLQGLFGGRLPLSQRRCFDVSMSTIVIAANIYLLCKAMPLIMGASSIAIVEYMWSFYVTSFIVETTWMATRILSLELGGYDEVLKGHWPLFGLWIFPIHEALLPLCLELCQRIVVQACRAYGLSERVNRYTRSIVAAGHFVTFLVFPIIWNVFPIWYFVKLLDWLHFFEDIALRTEL